jgi:hexosaminidase
LSTTRRTFLQVALGTALATACSRRQEEREPASPLMALIPVPLQVMPGAGQFRLHAGTPLEFAGAELAPIVERFRAEVARRAGLALAPARAGTTQGASIRIELAAAIDNDFDALPGPTGVSPAGGEIPDERHSLVIGTEGVVLRSVDAIGSARGLTSLLQLIALTPTVQGAIALPAARILDVPRFAWRGLTFDLTGTFFTADEIRRVIDLVALYKLNVLHLPLTSERGWRLETGRPSALQAPGNGFYTTQELGELVRYAAERFVTLVPGLHRPEDQVLAKVAAIFPGPFLQVVVEPPVAASNESHATYVQRLHEQLHSLGKRSIGLQESMRADTDGHAVIQLSTTDHGQFGDTAGEGKRPLPSVLPAATADTFPETSDHPGGLANPPVIVSPSSHACFDVPYAERSNSTLQEAARARLGDRRYRSRTVAEFFDWEPAGALGSTAAPTQLAGVGAVVSTDTVSGLEDLTFLLLPRLPGVAHKAWSEPRANIWSVHRRALAQHRRLWMQDRLSYFESVTVDW